VHFVSFVFFVFFVFKFSEPSLTSLGWRSSGLLRTQATDGWALTALARFFRIRIPRDNHPPGSVAAV